MPRMGFEPKFPVSERPRTVAMSIILTYEIGKLCQCLVSDILAAVIMKISVFWDITPLALWKSTDVSEEHIASTFRIK
jgi:hypothetical protein